MENEVLLVTCDRCKGSGLEGRTDHTCDKVGKIDPNAQPVVGWDW